jgi:hypothetical protein
MRELQLGRLCKKLAEPVAGNDGENVPGRLAKAS